MKVLPAFLSALLLFACTTAEAPAPASPLAAVPQDWAFPLNAEPARADSGLVATDARLATEVGVEVLRAGGNAVDAAIAVAFALAVVYPEAGNLGGGGFMVTHMNDGTAAALDFREKAPLAATRDMYVDAAGEVTDASVIGHQASGVPGAVMGLWEAHQRFGTKPWAELIAPAIRFARDGFVVDAQLARSIANAAERLALFDGSAALFLPGGEPISEGSTWQNPDLAAVLERIAERGPAGFYEGETADLIVAEMQSGGGLITQQDLANYRAMWREPVRFQYRGHEVISMPPASSGGITLALIAGILDGFDLRAAGWHSPRSLHLTAEAMRRAFADRNTFLGDPDFVNVPSELLSPAYIERLRASIDTAHATPSAEILPGAGVIAEPEHTTHFSIVDPMGNAVALTTTINDLYGSAVTVSGAGFLLNDEMDDFTSKPGVPNMYGLVQGAANAIEPGKRMLSAMTPTIVLDPNGEPLIVTGARGGPRIITAVFQVISNLLDYELDLGSAVNGPRIHHQHLPDVLGYEPNGLPTDIADSLRALGHQVDERSGYVGNAPTLFRIGNEWLGLSDPRSGGVAAGF